MGEVAWHAASTFHFQEQREIKSHVLSTSAKQGFFFEPKTIYSVEFQIKVELLFILIELRIGLHGLFQLFNINYINDKLQTMGHNLIRNTGNCLNILVFKMKNTVRNQWIQMSNTKIKAYTEKYAARTRDRDGKASMSSTLLRQFASPAAMSSSLPVHIITAEGLPSGLIDPLE